MYALYDEGGDDDPFAQDFAAVEEVELSGQEREGEKSGGRVEDFGISQQYPNHPGKG